jgi:hypothetical protein
LDVRNSCELLLDCDDGVIFIKGKKLNSKDVRSSAMTIRALSLLFESSVVSSNDLPKSAFTESHSEFKSKILNPLSRLVKNRASVNLSFEVLKTEFGFEFSVKEGAEYINILEVR